MSNTKKITRKAIQLPALLDDCQVPLPGYEALTLKIRLNPPQSTLRDDLPRGGGSISHEEQAALDNLRSLIENPEATPDTRAEAEKTIAEHAAIVADRTMRLGRALQVLFGATPVMEIETAEGSFVLDFSSPSASLQTYESEFMPEELATFLIRAPYLTAKRRFEVLEAELPNLFARKS